MGRGEEEGGFFDCYLSRSSFSRHIHPQQKKKSTQHKRNLQFFCYLLTFSLILFLHSSYFSLTSTVHRSTSVFFSSVFSSLFIAFKV